PAASVTAVPTTTLSEFRRVMTTPGSPSSPFGEPSRFVSRIATPLMVLGPAGVAMLVFRKRLPANVPPATVNWSVVAFSTIPVGLLAVRADRPAGTNSNTRDVSGARQGKEKAPVRW